MQSLVSLTFDDGFRCQFGEALPILNSYGMPATFFLIELFGGESLTLGNSKRN